MSVRLAVCVLALAVSGSALDREAFTITKYDLQIRLEPEQQRIGVRGTITLRNDSQRPQKNAVLQISSSLKWRSIQAEGKPLQFVSQPYESDIDHTGELSEAIVALPKDVLPGSTVDLTIGYEGVIVLDATRLTRIGIPKEQAIHSDWDQIGVQWTAVRGVGSVVWYPVATESANLSEGNSLFETLGRWQRHEEKARMQMQVEVPVSEGHEPPTVLCNGKAADARGTSGTGTADCSFPALGLSVPALVIGDYQILDGPTIRVAYRAEHKSNAEKFAQAAAGVTPFVTEWFGAPRERVQVAELADPGASPFESGTLLLTPLADTDTRLLQVVLVHQLTHAAFPSNRPWIYEGLAHFAQAVFRERQENRAAALDLLGLHRSALIGGENAVASLNQATSSSKPPANDAESLISTSVDEFSRSKAAYVWWMLRDLVGEEALKKALASYRSDEDKAPAYFQRLLQDQSKRDLQWFFDDWVYRDRGLPDFRIESAFARQASEGNFLVTITVENSGDAGAEVLVITRFEGGEISERVEVHGKAKAVVRVSTPKRPREIAVNDGSVPESDMGNNVFKVNPSNK
jgi:hypothetical protein